LSSSSLPGAPRAGAGILKDSRNIKLNGKDHSPAPKHGKLVKDDASW